LIACKLIVTDVEDPLKNTIKTEPIINRIYLASLSVQFSPDG
jgi:hypothetical protein